MIKNTFCEFGCNKKISEETIEFSDSYSISVHWDIPSKKFHECESNTKTKELVEKHQKFVYDLLELRDKGDFYTLKKRIQEHLPNSYTDWLSSFNHLAYGYYYCAEFEDAIKAAEIHLRMYPSMFGLWEIKWDSFIHLQKENEAIELLEDLLRRLLIYKKNREVETEYNEEDWDSVWEQGYAEAVLYEGFVKAYVGLQDVSKQIEYLEKWIKFLEENKDQLLESDDQESIPHGLYESELIRVYEKYGRTLLSQRKKTEASIVFEKATAIRNQSKIPKTIKIGIDLEESSIDRIDEFSKAVNIKKNGKKTSTLKSRVFFDNTTELSLDEMVGTLEIEFRALILRKLSKYDDWTNMKIPSDVWPDAERLKIEAEEDPTLLDTGRRIIDYVDFTDYIRMFDHKKNWAKIFQDVFKDRDLFLGNLKALQKYRNSISHHRGEKLDEYLKEHAHGHLIVLYRYFMHLIHQDEDKMNFDESIIISNQDGGVQYA